MVSTVHRTKSNYRKCGRQLQTDEQVEALLEHNLHQIHDMASSTSNTIECSAIASPVLLVYRFLLSLLRTMVIQYPNLLQIEGCVCALRFYAIGMVIHDFFSIFVILYIYDRASILCQWTRM